MKKRWKIFWIICAATLVLGIGLCVAGLALGASLSMIDEETPGWISFGTGGIEIGNTQEKQVPSNVQEQEFTGIHSIEVEASMIDLQILTTEDTDKITVKVEEGKLSDKVRCYREGGELVVKLSDKFKYNDVPGTLWIYIPEDDLREADIDVDAGTVYIEEIKANSLSVNVDAGEAVVEQFYAGEAEFACGAGRIEACGNVERELDTNCGAGEILLLINGKKEDYNYEVECGIGDVVIDNESHSGIRNKDKYSHGALKEMSIECGVGTITVEFE